MFEIVSAEAKGGINETNTNKYKLQMSTQTYDGVENVKYNNVKPKK